MNIPMGFAFLAAIALVSACSSRDSKGTQGTGGSGGAAGAAGSGTATTNTFVGSCAISSSGVSICMDYYDCVGADAAKIKTMCATAPDGIGSETRCRASGGGKCTILPSSSTPCTIVEYLPPGSFNQQICDTLKGTYTAP